jgi:plasmid stability protein
VAVLTIRGIDDELKARLRVRAARHGRSMEAEVRELLRAALDAPSARRGLGTRIHERFATLGGEELDMPPRGEPPRAADLGE